MEGMETFIVFMIGMTAFGIFLILIGKLYDRIWRWW
jgi:hypothetical protein